MISSKVSALHSNADDLMMDWSRMSGPYTLLASCAGELLRVIKELIQTETKNRLYDKDEAALKVQLEQVFVVVEKLGMPRE